MEGKCFVQDCNFDEFFYIMVKISYAGKLIKLVSEFVYVLLLEHATPKKGLCSPHWRCTPF